MTDQMPFNQTSNEVSVLIVFMDKHGQPLVLDLEEAGRVDLSLWRHIGSINAKSYIQNILSENPKLVAQMHENN